MASDGTETLISTASAGNRGKGSGAAPKCPDGTEFKCTCPLTNAACEKGDGCRKKDRIAVCVGADGLETPVRPKGGKPMCPDGKPSKIIHA